ncbi:hypothetical protein GCM10009677_22260 [Sphaerisporangium rubeum]|uniref:non-specific serine/threonine protein kinase n=1 Tax=Sphaerisporangium rubeum TaxID=321317 RepID=A0A7X0IJX1_9ACTN|nr:serine/threonine-protein kinase [Sphaerisporangium rubeum]MBB6476303.1 serine/threonine protein kinase [Sphaerisporangium rubeum]
MPEKQPRVLADRYELVAQIGRGTMGTVWRAHDRLLDRDVAVKEIRQDTGLNKEQRAELRERMIREGRSAAKITHPSVAAVHDTIVVDGRPWIVMELVEARSLEQVIEEEGPLPPRLVAEIGLDLLGALEAAHQQGILHRDVKPGNVLLTETGRVVLTDFGIAKAEGDANITKTGMVIGSPGYTAPERARGDHTGTESDLWSLGATLYFAVEGRPAYERRTVSETLAALMTEEAEPATQAGPLRPVLEALLEKDYTRRLTAAEATTVLRTIARTPARPTTSNGTAAPTGRPATPGPNGGRPTATPGSGSGRPATSPGSGSGRPDATPGSDGGRSATTKPGTKATAKPGAKGLDTPTPPVTRPAASPATDEPEDVDPNQTITVIRPKGGLRIPAPPADDDEPTMIGLPPVTSSPPPAAPRSAASAPPGAASAHPAEPRSSASPGQNTTARPPAPGKPSAGRPTTPVSPRRSPSPPPPPPARTQGPPARFGPRPPTVGPLPVPADAPASRPTSRPDAPAGPRPAPPPSTGPRPTPAPYGQAASSPAPPGPAAAQPYGDPGQELHTMRDPGSGLGTDLFAFQGPAAPRTSSPVGMIVLVVIALLGLGTIIMLAAAALSSARAGSSGPAVTTSGQATGGAASGAATVSDAVSAEPAAGLRRHTDSSGYVIDVPTSLQDATRGRTVTFTADGDPRTVRVSRSPAGSTDILATVRAAESRAVAAGTYPGYRRLALDLTRPTPYTGTDVADWEFTYTGASGPLRVLSRWVAVPGGSSYAIYWTAPEAAWRTHSPQLTAVLSSFRPVRPDAPGGS